MTEPGDTSSNRRRRTGGWRSIREFLRGQEFELARLASVSFVGGVAETGFLVLITALAFALTRGETTLRIADRWSLPRSWGLACAAVLVVIWLALAVLSSHLSARLVSEVTAATRRRLAWSFLNTAWSVQQREASGHLQELLTTFAQRGSELILYVTMTVESTFALLALVLLVIGIDPVGAVMVFVAAIVLGSILKPLRNGVRLRAGAHANSGVSFATSLNEVSQMALEIHVFRVQEEVVSATDSLIEANADAERRWLFSRGAVNPTYTGLAYLAMIFALFVIARSANANLTTLGSIIIIMLRSLSYGQRLQFAQAGAMGSVPFITALQDQLHRYTDGLPDVGAAELPSLTEVTLSDVTFGYTDDRPVLRNLNATIHPHEVIGVVGASGSGKSTLVQLLLGLREPDTGAVLVNGTPLHEFSRESVARRITFVPQRPHLLAGTISDNIRFHRPAVSDEAIRRAASLAHLDDEILAFPEGYDHPVGHRGDGVSGGQQQRICIARALVESPDLLILDEPTSALDARSELAIQETLTGLRHTMMVVIIAHRMSTLNICDRIMVIQEGELVAFDTPERLSENSAFYKDALTLSNLDQSGSGSPAGA